MTTRDEAKKKKPTSPSRRKKVQRWHEKRWAESKEFDGKSGEQIEDEAEAHMDMVLAPIHEAARKGEITPMEAMRRCTHEGIKAMQELIKDNEEDIDALLHFGMTDTSNPKLLAIQRGRIEKRRREDPTILALQKQIDDWKEQIAKYERIIQESYSKDS